ncbi:unnamed protein product [Caenorhabditis angaria]|uniref:Uncharacterized protein n=1 Tax=Caenorhabditis angaria TaxID=860376 RepID=A0A9P1IZP3_9PELO|nr:unnamed protein product [Caenorhabditis angaria]
MGARFSRNKIEEPQMFEHDEWGSDIDEQFCGPGKICGDDWTPLSLTPEPESELDLDARNDPEAITHQPLGTSYDSFILPEDPGFLESLEVQKEMIVPSKRSRKKKAKPKKPKKSKSKLNKIHVIIDIDNSQRIERTVDLTKDQNPIRTRHVSKTSKIHHIPVKILNKPVNISKTRGLQKIPKVLPPSPYKIRDQEDLTRPRFIQKHRSEIVYTRAVPPNRFRGMKIEPPDPFRIRRVS